MKRFLTLLTICFTLLQASAQTLTFHDLSAMTMAGDTVSMSQYYGKKVMVVNVASFCAWTPQYGPLEQLYQQYQQYNFEIIGFPSDDFGNQGGTDSQIIETCQDYGVTFPIMDKVQVVSGNIDPVFQWLQQANLNGVANVTVNWNFNKFLIDEAGHWVKRFSNNTDPLDTAITNWIMSPSVISSVPTHSLDETVELRNANPGASDIELFVKNTEPEHYSIHLFDASGRQVNTIFDGTAASQSIRYPLTSLAAGLYYIKIQSGQAQRTLRYTIVR